MTVRNVKLSLLIKRLTVIWVLVTIITLWSDIHKHLKNWARSGEKFPELGDDVRVKDVRVSRCYSWYRSCDAIWDYNMRDELVTWFRVDRDKRQDTAVGRGLLWRTYVYWQPTGPLDASAVVDLAMSHEGLPLGLVNERYNKIRNKDIDGYHVHSKTKTDYNFFIKTDRKSYEGASGSDLKWSAKFGNHLEEWFWKGDGLWCKYGPKSQGVKKIKAFIGSDFMESRPMWSEMVHCMPRQGFSKPISFSFLKSTSNSDSGKNHQFPREPHLLVKQNDFKILQLTDLHFGANANDAWAGSSSDYESGQPNSVYRFDSPNVQFVQTAIRNELPDLVVITGHLFKGFNKHLDYETQILKIVAPIITHGIPFVIAWGEDDLANEYKTQILNFIKELPFCLNKFDPNNSTNIMLPILSSVQGRQKRIGTIYAFDTNVTESYNFLKESPVPPESVFNFAFQHYPLQEYRPKGTFALIGSYEEKGSLDYLPPTIEFRNLLGKKNVKAFSCGHEHGNDCCILSDGKQQNLNNNMWLCYGGIAGYDPLYESKTRLFKIDLEKTDITSWKRTLKDRNRVFDYQYIWTQSPN